jgi:acetyltransferase
LLSGFRSQPGTDTHALAELVTTVGLLAHEVPELVEMDLNPVKVLQPGNGVCVVDARMRVAPVPPEKSPAMRDLPGVTNRPAV